MWLSASGMHLKELVSVCVSVHLLQPQFLNQCDVALFEMLRPRELCNLLDWFNPAFKGAFICSVGLLGCLAVDSLDRQVDCLLVEETVEVHALGLAMQLRGTFL